MESTNVFNLQKAMDDWLKANTDHLHITDDDKEEMLDHFRSTINELIKQGLSDEEAFAVAKIRFGGSDNWGDDFKQVSSDNFQAKKLITFFFGIMVYFIINLTILLFINLVYIGLDYFGASTSTFNLKTAKQFFYVVYIAVPILMFLLFRFRNKLLPYLKSTRLNFGKLLWAFAILLVVLAGERYTYPLIRTVLEPLQNWQYILTQYRTLQRDFQFYFPIIIIISFIILFLLYRKKNYL
ncbi:permease prefix domain 1-containing protein [Maribellus sediminis]|uniref:permease prefix domain 1-containing protein n=1 Tax=Maribellus sediminis TaxID=2696285 RepID=UPI00142FD1B3|nr:permease prefix domain 1-containing protein [Maribellus sediminis]